MITITQRGSFKHTEKFLQRTVKMDYHSLLAQYGEEGVAALAAATPERSGTTAASWHYSIERTDSGFALYFSNSNVNHGVNIAILLQYGHGTRNGGYVEGIDYINPALKPIFEKIADRAWKEVSSK